MVTDGGGHHSLSREWSRCSNAPESRRTGITAPGAVGQVDRMTRMTRMTRTKKPAGNAGGPSMNSPRAKLDAPRRMPAKCGKRLPRICIHWKRYGPDPSCRTFPRNPLHCLCRERSACARILIEVPTGRFLQEPVIPVRTCTVSWIRKPPMGKDREKAYTDYDRIRPLKRPRGHS